MSVERDALDIARAVAGEAAALLRTAAGTATEVRAKSTSRDLVTEWDMRAEALIRERLHKLTPAVPLLGEEGGASRAHGDGVSGSEPGGDSASSDELRWLVDPIDGTINFLHGLPIFSVVIALERAGRPVVGVVHAPALGWEFHGRRGHGAYLGDERLAVSELATLEQSLLATGFPYDRATNPDNNLDVFAHIQKRAGGCRRLGSAALDLCLVARGAFDGYWERRLNPWDVAAGALLVQEAGGRVSAYDGGLFSSSAGEVVASNGHIHAQLLAELAEARLDGERSPPSDRR